ncbi:hypothetical protein T492DRAFT_847870 [Pavlovales sp. CCMP2436]|nr:hypothetical protein T492DRAFT_847870 [Pavlovales sp. CCMP2436]
MARAYCLDLVAAALPGRPSSPGAGPGTEVQSLWRLERRVTQAAAAWQWAGQTRIRSYSIAAVSQKAASPTGASGPSSYFVAAASHEAASPTGFPGNHAYVL